MGAITRTSMPGIFDSARTRWCTKSPREGSVLDGNAPLTTRILVRTSLIVVTSY